MILLICNVILNSNLIVFIIIYFKVCFFYFFVVILFVISFIKTFLLINHNCFCASNFKFLIIKVYHYVNLVIIFSFKIVLN